MAYVIAEPCIGVKDTACVDACPVDCIHPGKKKVISRAQPSSISTRRNALTAPPVFRSVRWRPFCPRRSARQWAHYAGINAAHYEVLTSKPK